MNVNLMIMDALPAPQTQPSRSVSTHKANKSDDFSGNESRLGQTTSKTVEENTGYEHSEPSQTSDTKQQREVSQSDNVKTEKPVRESKAKDSHFKKILKQRLSHDESEAKQDAEKVAAQSQTSETSAAPEQQVQVDNSTATVTLTDIATPDQPRQFANDSSASNQSTPIVLNVGHDSKNLAQFAANNQNSQGQNPQIQPLTNIPGNNQNEAIKGQVNQSTTTQMPVIEQAQGQVQTPPIPPTPTNVDNSQKIANTTQQNIDSNTNKVDLSVNQTNGDSSKPDTLVNQNNLNNANTVPTVSTNNQPALEQSKSLVDLPVNQTSGDSGKPDTLANQNNLNNATTTPTVSAKQPVLKQSKVQLADLPVNLPKADSNAKTVSVNQDNLDNGKASSAVSANQPALSQSKVQLADLTVTTTSGNSDAGSISTSTTAGGLRADTETHTNNHAKNNTAGEKQGDNSQITAERSTFTTSVGAMTAGFDKVKVETVYVEDAKTSSQTSGLSSQPVNMQAVVSTSSQITGDQPIFTNHTQTPAKNSSAQDTASSVREQISLSVQNSLQAGERQITVNLNPPELGRVSIKFTERGGELTGTLEASNSQTRAEIQQAVPEMLRSLEQSGINIKRIDVSISDLSRQPTQDFSRNNTAGSQWEQLGQQGFNDAGGNRFSQDSFVHASRWGTASDFSGATGLDYDGVSASDSTLNVLI
jgi:flagellar hook-length control protein FliK